VVLGVVIPFACPFTTPEASFSARLPPPRRSAFLFGMAFTCRRPGVFGHPSLCFSARGTVQSPCHFMTYSFPGGQGPCSLPFARCLLTVSLYSQESSSFSLRPGVFFFSLPCGLFCRVAFRAFFPAFCRTFLCPDYFPFTEILFTTVFCLIRIFLAGFVSLFPFLFSLTLPPMFAWDGTPL